MNQYDGVHGSGFTLSPLRTGQDPMRTRERAKHRETVQQHSSTGDSRMAIATYSRPRSAVRPTSADKRYARDDARTAAREAANREAAQAAVAAGFPELEGTEKQVDWATTIRHSFAQYAGLRMVAAIDAGDGPLHAAMLDVYDSAIAETRASWWIDNGRGIRVPLSDGSLQCVSTFDVALYARRIAE